jgi:hypothetical protein
VNRFSAGVLSVEGKRVIVGDTAGSNNSIVTYTGANTVDGSANLTFDGSLLQLDGESYLAYDSGLGTDPSFSGEVTFVGGGSGLTAGNLVYLNSSGNWVTAIASSLGSSAATSLLGIAMGTTGAAGVLLFCPDNAYVETT